MRADRDLGEDVWCEAARAYGGYAERRRMRRGDRVPGPILADFVVRAHALLLATAMLTFGRGKYRAASLELEVLIPEA